VSDTATHADLALALAIAASGSVVSEWDIVADRVRWLSRPEGLIPPGLPERPSLSDLVAGVHPGDRDRFLERVRATLEDDAPYAGDLRVLDGQGRIRWLAERGYLVRDVSGRPRHLYVVAVDVTEAREVEQELTRARRRFRAMHDSSPDAVILVEPILAPSGQIDDFRYVYLNPTALRFSNRTEAEMLGGRILDFFPENREHGLHDRYCDVYRTGEPYVDEFAYEGGGLAGWFRTTVVRIGDELAITVADITDRKRIEEQLREALERQTLLLREMNHRVKNSLQMVASLVMIHKHRTADTAAQALLDEVVERVQTVAKVHRTLYRGDRYGDVDLHALTADIVEGLDTVAASTIRVAAPRGTLRVPVDQAIPLGLVVNELVTNAVKYAAPARITVTLDLTGDEGSLQVADQGPGLPHGFDWRYSPTLGMMLVRTLAGQLGGDITFDTGPGGTTAHLRWPLQATDGTS